MRIRDSSLLSAQCFKRKSKNVNSNGLLPVVSLTLSHLKMIGYQKHQAKLCYRKASLVVLVKQFQSAFLRQQNMSMRVSLDAGFNISLVNSIYIYVNIYTQLQAGKCLR